jgi:hypothetical protein
MVCEASLAHPSKSMFGDIETIEFLSHASSRIFETIEHD